MAIPSLSSRTARREPSRVPCLLILAASLLLAPLSAQGQICEGSSSTGGIILKTITLDGNPADWAEVLAGTAQTTVDGDGSSMASGDCAALSTDRDCPVGQAGRDIAVFSWTYDTTHIYLYQSRYGSLSSIQTFFFYMDVGLDQFMGPTDYVLKVDYWGSNRKTEVQLFRYIPPDGTTPISMVDASGYADGYNIPGGYTPINDPACQLCTAQVTYFGFNSVPGGPLGGEGFEARIPWDDVGVGSPRPVYFHVSANNPAGQILDNCGSPDGGIGTFGIHGLSIGPAGATTIGVPASDAQVAYGHVVTNTGLFTETAALSAVSSFGFRLDFYDAGTAELMATDLNGDGDFSDPGDSVNPAYDSDSDGLPDSGPLSPGGTYGFELRLTVPAGTTPRVEETAVTAAATGTDVRACITDTTTIGDVQIDPDHSKAGAPGAVVPFCHAAWHFFPSETLRLSGVSSLAWSLSFYADAEGDGTPGDLMGTDASGDGDFSDPGDYLNPAYDTDGDGYPDTGVLSSGAAFPLVVTVQIPIGTPVGTAQLTEVSARASGLHGYSSDWAADTLEAQPALAIDPDRVVSAGTNVYAASGQSLYLPHTTTNASAASDSALLTQTVTQSGSPVSWTVRYWTDPDCDGSIADGAVLAGSSPALGPIAEFGGESCLVAELQVPGTALDGATVRLTITAASANAPSTTDTAVDEALISKLVSCADSSCTQPQTSFSACQTLYARGYHWAGGTLYNLHYLDGGGNDVSGAILTVVNGLGQFAVGYTPQPGDLPGSWTVRMNDETDTALVKEIDVTVSAVSPAISGPTAICAREAVLLEAPEGYAAYLWSPGGQTARSIAVSPSGTTAYTVTATDASGCQGTSAPHTVTVSSCKNLLRNAQVTCLNPQTPESASIFSGGDPALNPGPDDEQLDFASGADFPHDVTDLTSTCPLVFYELENDSGSTLRVNKSGGKVIITF
jgi:hypothetical protein